MRKTPNQRLREIVNAQRDALYAEAEKVAHAQGELSNVKEANVERQRQIGTMQGRLDSYRAENEGLQRKIEMLEADNASMNRRLVPLGEEVSRHKLAIENRDRRIAVLSADAVKPRAGFVVVEWTQDTNGKLALNVKS